MESHRLVLPEDLNQYGHLFGGRLLAWVDEASWIAASLEFPECRFVTIGMDRVEFRHGVKKGAILAIESSRVNIGTSSVQYEVIVRLGRAQENDVIFRTNITFVNVDAAGNKVAIPIPIQ